MMEAHRVHFVPVILEDGSKAIFRMSDTMMKKLRESLLRVDRAKAEARARSRGWRRHLRRIKSDQRRAG